MSYSLKRSLYYSLVVDMYYVRHLPVSRICKIVPVSRKGIYNWISTFASENPEKLSEMQKKKAPSGLLPVPESTVPSQKERSLRARICELERELCEERVRSEAYSTMIDLAESSFNIEIRKKCGAKQLFGVTKQAYYKHDESRAFCRSSQESFVLEYVRGVRASDPGMGCGKLWYMYRRDFSGNSPVGRDRFLSILDRHGLKVRHRVRRPRTTDSSHGLPTYPDLTREFVPTGADQLWVSDITYIAMWPDEYTCVFCYLSLILDAYSEEIVGYSVGPTLETSYPLEALHRALARIEGRTDVCLIHHSDRGVQYASSRYVRTLAGYGIRISMTEGGDPRENAQAERVNGTMKNELLKGRRFRDIGEVRRAVGKAVRFYNNERPHMSIGMMTPAQAARCTGTIPKCWESPRQTAIIKKREILDYRQNPLSLQPDSLLPSGLRPSESNESATENGE